MATNNLSWRASASRPWITVRPSEGVGTQDVRIITEPSTTYQDPDTAGTVTFICTDCPEENIVSVNVTRCAQTECTYEPTGVTTYSAGEFSEIEVEACDESTDDITIESITVYKSTNGCPDSSVTKSYTTAYTFSANETSGAVTYVFYYPGQDVGGYATITVNQAAGPCHITCDCNDFELQYKTQKTIGNEAKENLLINTITKSGDCITDVTAYTEESVDWITALGVNDSSGITATVLSNGDAEQRDTNINVSFKVSGETCTDEIKTFKLKQNGIGCQCGNFDIDDSNIPLIAGETTARSFTKGCTDSHEVESDDESIAEVEITEDDKVSITGISTGNTVITITYNADNKSCTKTINVIVTCPTITFNPDNGSGYGGEEPVKITITES